MKFEVDTSLIDNLKKYNAQFITEKFDVVKNSNSNYVLVHMNVKNFRYFSTKFSKAGSDEILSLLLKELWKAADEGEYAAYLYADNFAVLYKYDDIHSFVYDRMMKVIDNIYRIDDERIFRNIYTSMGIYEIKDKNIEFQDALNLANICRKECDTLKNRSFCMEVYEEKFYNKYMERLELEINTADAYKNYKFTNYLQPKIDLKTGEIVGTEALLRWFDENGNSVPLYKFLPILNQNSYIQLVDMDIFENMCKILDERIK